MRTPSPRADSKLDSKSSLHLVNELADLHNCNNALYFEARRHEDLYMWASRTPNGPSIKCHVQNVHTMDELKLTGNCLKGSRGIVVFDGEWESKEEWRLLKEVFGHVSPPRSWEGTYADCQIFSVPRTSRRLKPFIDHIILLSILDGRIWFRNYQIIDKDPLVPNGPPQTSLVEIGPRFVLNPIRVFEGSFGGPTVYANQEFVSPAATRASLRAAAGQRYKVRKLGQDERAERAERYQDEVPEDELARDKVFA